MGRQLEASALAALKGYLLENGINIVDIKLDDAEAISVILPEDNRYHVINIVISKGEVYFQVTWFYRTEMYWSHSIFLEIPGMMPKSVNIHDPDSFQNTASIINKVIEYGRTDN